MPYSLEASVSRTVLRSASNGLTIVLSDVNVFLTRLKSSSCSDSQTHAVPFLSRSLILLSMCERSGMNAPNCCARPRNERRSEVLLGLGKSVTALYLSSFGLIPWSEIMCPAKSSVEPISNYFFEMVTLYCLHRSSTVLTLCSSVEMSSAQINVSSTIFLAQGRPRIILSE